MVAYKKPTIFISYASEDSVIATVVEGALNSLSESLNFGIDIVRDIHTFKIGSSLKGQVLEKLKTSDFLFVVYTKALKKSHSYTGSEIGAFQVYMDEERSKGKTDRSIVCLYLDEMPDPVPEILGIKLDINALAHPDPTQRASRLDPSKSLSRFFCDIVDLYIARQEDSPDDKAKLKELKKKTVVEKIAPTAEEGLVSALAGLVASNSIEQRLFEIRWPASSSIDFQKEGVMSDAELRVSDDDVLKIFGIEENQKSLSWNSFQRLLAKSNAKHSSFIINAIEEAARSGLSSGPVDNEQFFISKGGIYRVIVTRQYAFYNGSKYMHMYFIPFLSRYAGGLPSTLLAYLSMAARFRLIFLTGESGLSVGNFAANMFDKYGFKEMVCKYIRQFLLIDDESHVYQLDEPGRYMQFCGQDADADKVSEDFEKWKERKESLLAVTSKFLEQIEQSADPKSLMKDWIQELRLFNEFIDPINKQLGSRAASMLKAWFETGIILN